MKRRAILSAVSVVCLLMFALPASAQVLFSDNFDDGILDGWTLSPATGNVERFQLVRHTANNPSYSGEWFVSQNTGYSGGNALMTRTIPECAGFTNLRITVYAKTQGSVDEADYFEIAYRWNTSGAGSTWAREWWRAEWGDGWNKFELNVAWVSGYPTAPTANFQIRLGSYMSDPDELVCFEDVVVEVIPADTPRDAVGHTEYRGDNQLGHCMEWLVLGPYAQHWRNRAFNADYIRLDYMRGTVRGTGAFVTEQTVIPQAGMIVDVITTATAGVIPAASERFVVRQANARFKNDQTAPMFFAFINPQLNRNWTAARTAATPPAHFNPGIVNFNGTNTATAAGFVESVFSPPPSPYRWQNNTNQWMTYLCTYAENLTTQPLSVYIGFRYDEPSQIYVNGVEVGVNNTDTNTMRQEASVQFQHGPVSLRPGKNLIMVKLFNLDGAYSFAMLLQTASNATNADDPWAGRYWPGLRGKIRYTTDPMGYSYPAGVGSVTVSRRLIQPYGPGATDPGIVELVASGTAGTDAFVKETISGLVPGQVSIVSYPTDTASSVVASGSSDSRVEWSIPNTGIGVEKVLRYQVVPGAQCARSYTLSGSYTYSAGQLSGSYTGECRAILQKGAEWATASGTGSASFKGVTVLGTDLARAWRGAYWGATCRSYWLLASGADIWGSADQMTFLYTPVKGNFLLVARVLTLDPSTHSWAKAGIMLRKNLSAGSPFVMVCETNGGPNLGSNRDLSFQWRDSQDGSPGSGLSQRNRNEAELRLKRIFDPVIDNQTIVIAGFNTLGDEDSGVPKDVNVPYWQIRQLGTATGMTNIPDAAYVGLAFTSHQSGQAGMSRFRSVSLTATQQPVPAVMSASRVLPASYTPGNYLTVTLNIAKDPAAAAGSLTVEETLPSATPAWTTVRNITSSIAATSTVASGKITWTIANFNADALLSYEVQAPSTATDRVVWSGVVTEALGFEGPIGGQNLIWGVGFTFKQGFEPMTGKGTYTGCEDAHLVMVTIDRQWVYNAGPAAYTTWNLQNRNTGASVVLEEGTGLLPAAPNSDCRIPLVAFKNIEQYLPRGCTIASAQLKLRVMSYGYAAPTLSHRVYAAPLLKSWGEGLGSRATGSDGYHPVGGDVCWTSARWRAETWQGNGARGPTDVGAQVAFADVPVGTGQWVTWNLPPAVVQNWLDNPTQNFGLKLSQDDLIIGPTGLYTMGVFQFGSRQNTSSVPPSWSTTSTSNGGRPELAITVTPSTVLRAKNWELYH